MYDIVVLIASLVATSTVIFLCFKSYRPSSHRGTDDENTENAPQVNIHLEIA